MTFAIFLVLVCLGPIAIMCEEYTWIPATVPALAQQCLNLRQGFVGECTIAPQVARTSRGYRNTGICVSLKCAKPKVGGGHKIDRWGRPLDGTPCGILKACKGGSCVEIPAYRVPLKSGSEVTVDCRP